MHSWMMMGWREETIEQLVPEECQHPVPEGSQLQNFSHQGKLHTSSRYQDRSSTPKQTSYGETSIMYHYRLLACLCTQVTGREPMPRMRKQGTRVVPRICLSGNRRCGALVRLMLCSIVAAVMPRGLGSRSWWATPSSTHRCTRKRCNQPALHVILRACDCVYVCLYVCMRMCACAHLYCVCACVCVCVCACACACAHSIVSVCVCVRACAYAWHA